MLKTPSDYIWLARELDALSARDRKATIRDLCRTDLYFLLWFALGRDDVSNQWILDRCKEVQASPNEHLDLWAREHYKLQRLDEPTPTPTGWKLHGELVVGDELFGPDGSVCEVVALNRVVTDSDNYEIEFDDGFKIQAGAGHLWPIEIRTRKRIPMSYDKPGPQRLYRESVLLKTEDIFKHDHTQDSRLAIAINEPLELPVVADLPIHPYLLGAWLGDGTSVNGNITCGDSEVFEFIAVLGYGMSNNKTPHRNAELRSVDGLSAILKTMGIRGKGNKAIPSMYLRSSKLQRLHLLQGLMDTDGHCNTRGTATFVNINECLIDGVVELCHTLGLKPTKRKYEITYKDAPYFYWQVSFQAYRAMPVFRIRRKLERSKSGDRKKPRRYIVACKKVAPVPMRCIQVSRRDGLYLTGKSFITTHNSTIITFALTIQDILSSHGDNPDPKWNGREVTLGIFSVTRPLAKGFLRQIKLELEQNEMLKDLFPDILYADPKSDAAKWSEDDGLIVKRRTNPKEATIEAWGVVDGQPTSKHFLVCVYDDLVTDKFVTSPEMIEKTNRAWELSINLGTEGGYRRYVGTIYHFNDTYQLMKDRGAVAARVYPCTDDGTPSGNPVLKSKEEILMKYRTMGAYTFSAQMLLNPVSDTLMGFRRDWLRYYSGATGHGMNIFILVDPANEKKKNSDFTVFMVIGLASDENYYLLDMVRDRLSLTERADMLFKLHRKYKPYCRGLRVGYEQYGMQADVAHIEDRQVRENYRFDIYKLGGKMPKNDRIKQLQPIFQQHRFFILESCFKTDYQGRTQDLVDVFLNQEYDSFPVPVHDDMLDCMARIMDKDFGATFPASTVEPDAYAINNEPRTSSWAN